MWQNLNKAMANNGVPNPNFKDSWLIVLRPIGKEFELSMVMELQMNRWLIENKFVFFTRVNLWTNTRNNRSSQSFETNIGHCAMNTKMPFLWKRQMFGMEQFTIGGILRRPLMQPDFKSWRIGSIFGTYV
jgi:hypothetical protein